MSLKMAHQVSAELNTKVQDLAAY